MRKNEAEKVIFIILGATGDLAKKKLIPAVYNIIRKGKTEIKVIGCARRKVKKYEILEASKPYISLRNDTNAWKKLGNSFEYLAFDFHDSSGYEKLAEAVRRAERELKTEHKIFYLATLPQNFRAITDNLKDSGIADNAKVAYEKPFGRDLASATALNACILNCFEERKIYRVDHYLAKEIVANILLVRFTNKIFHAIWNSKNIENVQIILKEDFGINGRGRYYDGYGAIKDVFQSHIIQLIALTAMEKPEKIEHGEIAKKKLEIIKKIRIEDFIIAQYLGYREEKDVNQNSETETFFACKLGIDSRALQGVPFFIKTGKYLDKRETRIDLKFRAENFLSAEKSNALPNYFTFKIFPEQGFSLEINAKALEEHFKTETIALEFCHACRHAANTPEAYEVIIEEIIKGDKLIFISREEIEESWKIVDEIERKKERKQLYFYEKGSSGFKELEDFNEKHGISWRA